MEVGLRARYGIIPPLPHLSNVVVNAPVVLGCTAAVCGWCTYMCVCLSPSRLIRVTFHPPRVASAMHRGGGRKRYTPRPSRVSPMGAVVVLFSGLVCVEFFPPALLKYGENVVPTHGAYSRINDFFLLFSASLRNQDAGFSGARENGSRRRGKSTINLRPSSSSSTPMLQPPTHSACIHNEVGEKAAEGETGGRGEKRPRGSTEGRGRKRELGGEEGNMRGSILALSCKMAFPVELDAVPLQ